MMRREDKISEEKPQQDEHKTEAESNLKKPKALHSLLKEGSKFITTLVAISQADNPLIYLVIITVELNVLWRISGPGAELSQKLKPSLKTLMYGSPLTYFFKLTRI